MAQTPDLRIEVDKSTLGAALKNGPLRVPNFQREYSWKGDRVRKLFDDLQNAMTKKQSSYFLGTVVLTPGRPPCLIDGQQRFATTTIFLAAVRDALIGLKKDKAAKSVEDDFLIMYDRSLKEYIPRLTLNVDDREYMKRRVVDRPGDPADQPAMRLISHRLIDQAARIAAERVAKIMDNADKPSRKVDALDEWIDFIHYNAIIVMLMPPNAGRAYQMYKTLNDRAQRTTQADMIKNHLFEQADDPVDEAQSKWSSMRSIVEGMGPSVGDDPLLGYLHHVSIAFNGPVLLEDIFERMEEKAVGRTSALQFLDALATHAVDYMAIMAPDHGKWGSYDQRVRKWVDHIAREIRMTFIRPLMLAVAARFTPAETQRTYRAFVSWVVRFLIAGGSRTGVVEKTIGDVAHKVYKREITTAKEVADAVLRIVPNDTRFHTAFCGKTLANARQVRFILRELEAEARGGKPDELIGPVDDTSVVTLEHILPLNLASARGWEYYSSDERRALRNRIGNQALLGNRDNGAIGDKPFAEKRPIIERSKNIVLTADVITRTEANQNQWTAANIAERQKMLADLAVKRWPLDIK